jgi:acetyl esterase
MTLDPKASAYLHKLHALNFPAVSEQTPAEARAGYETSTPALFGEPDTVAAIEDTDAGGVPVRIFTPHNAGGGALLYFHGGGWVIGGPGSHGPVAQTLAARSGATTILVDYRLAPEDAYPAAIDDCFTVTVWAAAHFARIAVAGDSAGGQLAASTALRARELAIPLSLQALIYPVTNYPDPDTYGDVGVGTTLDGQGMRWYWDQYVLDRERIDEPDCSPLRAPDLSGLAPALILTAEYDPLRAEAEAYAARLREAGVPVTLHDYAGYVHGFIRMRDVLDQADTALTEVAEAVAAAVAP